MISSWRKHISWAIRKSKRASYTFST